MRKIIAAALLVFCVSQPAQAELERKYVYIHNDGEYSIMLPDAPKGVTIWADDESIPYLDTPPKFGAVGEYALLRRVDPKTEDYFDVKVTFLKADRDFLLSLTPGKVADFLEDDYHEIQLDKKDIQFSAGSDTLKWGTITGFSVDSSNRLLYNVEHFLAGMETITVIRVQYSVENERFNEMYKNLSSSIKFVGK